MILNLKQNNHFMGLVGTIDRSEGASAPGRKAAGPVAGDLARHDHVDFRRRVDAGAAARKAAGVAALIVLLHLFTYLPLRKIPYTMQLSPGGVKKQLSYKATAVSNPIGFTRRFPERSGFPLRWPFRIPTDRTRESRSIPRYCGSWDRTEAGAGNPFPSSDRPESCTS